MATSWETVDSSPVPLMAAGEDRCFGGAHSLCIDLLPHSSHDTAKSPASERLCKSQVAFSCTCQLQVRVLWGAASVCHPSFHYNHHRLLQKLRRLMVMCQSCKRSTHLGIAAINGEKEAALEHLRRVCSVSVLLSVGAARVSVRVPVSD